MALGAERSCFGLVFDDGELNEHPENARNEIEALTEIVKVAGSYNLLSRAVSTSTCLSECVAAHIKRYLSRYILLVTTNFILKRGL